MINVLQQQHKPIFLAKDICTNHGFKDQFTSCLIDVKPQPLPTVNFKKVINLFPWIMNSFLCIIIIISYIFAPEYKEYFLSNKSK